MERVLQIVPMCLFEVMACDLLFRSFFTDKKNMTKYHLGLIIALTCFNSIIVFFCHISALKSLLSAICTSCILWALYDTSIIYSFICTISFIALTMCVELPFYLLIPVIMGNESFMKISNNYTFLTISGLIVKLIVIVLILCISRIFGKNGYLRLLNKKIWIFLMLLSITTIIVLLQSIFGNIAYFPVYVAILLLFINVFCYYYLQENGFQNKRAYEIALMEETMRQQLKQFENTNTYYSEQRKKIHEFKNHIDFISGLIDTNNYELLKEYTDKIQNEIRSQTPSIETENPIINVLVNNAIKKSINLGIAILPDINIKGNIIISDDDLVIIVSNLLNNAIEGCEKLTHFSKLINFKLISSPSNLTISCSNPIEQDLVIVDNLINTSKHDDLNHGFGMRNIRHSVNKYNGLISITANNNKFIYTISIDKMER